MASNKYFLDANVLIQAWQKYYSPNLCPDYWERLNELGSKDIIALPEMVYNEISKTEDDLSAWLKRSDIKKVKITEDVTSCLKDIYSKNEKHKLLVDNRKGRSLADPWLIAHAMSENRVVVTKEVLITQANSKTVRIPNVCNNMGIRWIDDFEFINELNFHFSCNLKD